MKVTVCPGGQLKPSEAAVGGLIVRLPMMLPFLSAVKVPLCVTAVVKLRLLAAEGFLLPPLTQAYVVAAVALICTVSTDPLARPASLNFTVRFAPEIEALVAFLMKCGLPPAVAAPAVMTTAVTATASSVVVRLRMLMVGGP